MDYSNGKIYKITNDIDDDTYIGSTTSTLTKRWSNHKAKSKICNTPIYTKMREMGIEHFCISLIENFPCSNKTELERREGYFIRLCGNINRQIQGRTTEERRIENCDIIKLQRKAYYEKNRNYIIEKQNQYYTNNKDICNTKKKEHYEEHKSERINKQKQYYLENADKIKQKHKEKTKCECGCIINRYFLKKHQNTQKHLEKVNYSIQSKNTILN